MNVDDMKTAILKKKTAIALECMEVVMEVLEEYNCTLVAVPEFVEVTPGVFATTYSWKIAVLDE